MTVYKPLARYNCGNYTIVFFVAVLLCAWFFVDGGTLFKDDQLFSFPPIIWYAPFLSRGGYCSEAISFMVPVCSHKIEVYLSFFKTFINLISCFLPFQTSLYQLEGMKQKLQIVQHGDSSNYEFYQGLDPRVREAMDVMLVVVPRFALSSSCMCRLILLCLCLFCLIFLRFLFSMCQYT